MEYPDGDLPAVSVLIGHHATSSPRSSEKQYTAKNNPAGDSRPPFTFIPLGTPARAYIPLQVPIAQTHPSSNHYHQLFLLKIDTNRDPIDRLFPRQTHPQTWYAHPAIAASHVQIRFRCAALFPNKSAYLTVLQADSLTEEQVSEFREAFSLFVSLRIPVVDQLLTPPTGQGWRWYAHRSLTLYLRSPGKNHGMREPTGADHVYQARSQPRS